MKLKLYEAILHTGGPTAETEAEDQGYLRVLAAMDGQRAIVAPSLYKPGEYDYLGLIDPDMEREVAYLMEQDPTTGGYIDQRAQFDLDYDSGAYCPDEIWQLKKEWVEVLTPGEA